jgi:hypothetical protein
MPVRGVQAHNRGAEVLGAWSWRAPARTWLARDTLGRDTGQAAWPGRYPRLCGSVQLVGAAPAWCKVTAGLPGAGATA